MPCYSGKVEYPTRTTALDAQKHLVWLNHARGNDAKSAGLNVYPCPHCSAWHVGHQQIDIPIAYHYTCLGRLDDIEAADALCPRPPRRIPKHIRRQLSGPKLLLRQATEEREPLLWFSWNGKWDMRVHAMPHPFCRFPCEKMAAWPDNALVRFSVPASFAKLRWMDYLALNHTSRWVRDTLATFGNPADWLATDQPVPLSSVERIEALCNGQWVPVEDSGEPRPRCDTRA